jgi:hypothetical protein
MLRCTPAPEPEGFDQAVRKKGNEWLSSNPGKIPKDLWSDFKPQLEAAFDDRCAYTAMYVPSGVGTVEHYLSKRNYPQLAYEWSNYRHAINRVNGCKGNLDDLVLDPFEVEDDWFAIQIPDLQLVLTDKIPAELRDKATFTIEKLQLQNSPWILRQRRRWYNGYLNGKYSLELLDEDAPMIARAIRAKALELKR